MRILYQCGEQPVQRSSHVDLLNKLLTEVHAIEADLGAARDAVARIDAFRAQVEAACHDTAAMLRTLQAGRLTEREARRVRETALARLQDQRTRLAHAEQMRREATDRMARAVRRLTAARRVLEHLNVTDEEA
jgi:hypothetical protein